MKKWSVGGLLLLLILSMLAGCTMQEENVSSGAVQQTEKVMDISKTQEESDLQKIIEEGQYHSKEEVAEYLKQFSKLPSNYITKKEAMKLGWKNKEGNLWEVAEGKSIGGDVFGNREKKLPEKAGRIWYECDIDYEGGFRNEKRIVYSDDGLIYYTGDHYEHFEKME